MEQEYPGSMAEALAPSRATAFFNADALTAMLAEARGPEMRRGGLVRIWRKPVVAGKYVGGGDVCWGHASAWSCFVLADWQTGVQVAEIYGRPDHAQYAQAIAELIKEDNNAYFGIEADGEAMGGCGGGRVWGCLRGIKIRPVILGELEEAVRLRGVLPLCREAVGEMLSFARNEKGRAEALPGAYADHVMAWAWLWQMRKFARYNASGRVATASYAW